MRYRPGACPTCQLNAVRNALAEPYSTRRANLRQPEVGPRSRSLATAIRQDSKSSIGAILAETATISASHQENAFRSLAGYVVSLVLSQVGGPGVVGLAIGLWASLTPARLLHGWLHDFRAAS